MHPDAHKLLWDAHRAAGRVAAFASGKSFEPYQADVLLRSAVERQLEIVGEALNQLHRVDPDTGCAIPDLRRIVGFRNVLIHAYASVDDTHRVGHRPDAPRPLACGARCAAGSALMGGSSTPSPQP